MFKPHATADAAAVGFVGGDGTVTLVDNVHSPSRLFGTTQFLGVGTIDIDPSVSVESPSTLGERDDDDDDCGGLCFVQGDDFIGVPLAEYFPEPSSFPYFVQPYALHSQHPTDLYFHINATNASCPAAFWKFHIADSVTKTEDIGAPVMVVPSPPGGEF